MENKGFNYSFTLPELSYFLFGNKKCPKCGGKLVRTKKFETRTDMFHRTRVDSIFHPGQMVKCYNYVYNCKNCGFKNSLSNLANSNKCKRKIK
ncbi:MAG: hypothetical protein E7166_05350 [Firmicutes bacterium]|nr:hypothetical protein [Bacillota bacterium]